MQKTFKIKENLALKNKFNLEICLNIKEKNLLVAQIYKEFKSENFKVTTHAPSFNLKGAVWFNAENLEACFNHIKLKNQPVFNFGKLEIEFKY